MKDIINKELLKSAIKDGYREGIDSLGVCMAIDKLYDIIEELQSKLNVKADCYDLDLIEKKSKEIGKCFKDN